MSSPCLERTVRSAIAIVALATSVTATAGTPLRVCVDPDNMPYSRRDQSGFEPLIARVLADAIGAPLQLQWHKSWRRTPAAALRKRLCDVQIGVPSGLAGVATTRPYYSASYVLVTNADDGPAPVSIDDSRLLSLRLGIQLVGANLAATPPGQALARRGAVQNVTGFVTLGATPVAQRMIAALEADEIDAAVLWGPQAGWFAAHSTMPTRITALAAPTDTSAQPFEFAIAVGVRPDDLALRDRLQTALDEHRREIDAILAAHHVLRSDAAKSRP